MSRKDSPAGGCKEFPEGRVLKIDPAHLQIDKDFEVTVTYTNKDQTKKYFFRVLHVNVTDDAGSLKFDDYIGQETSPSSVKEGRRRGSRATRCLERARSSMATHR